MADAALEAIKAATLGFASSNGAGPTVTAWVGEASVFEFTPTSLKTDETGAFSRTMDVCADSIVPARVRETRVCVEKMIREEC